MSITVESLLEQAKSLSDSQRVELAKRLYDTVPLPEMPEAWTSEEEAETAWQDELLARLDRFDRGETTAIPAEEVFDRLVRQFGRADTIRNDE